MNHGSLFSGVGGWSVASDQMGWKTLFCCEWDENKQYILKHHWPKSEVYGDITTTDFTIWRNRIDILTASTPCQPFSLAGKRAGANDVRHLWPETIRTVREIQPQWFVLENVPGLVNWSKGMVFKQIIADLENEGYEVLPFLLPACGVNAPHKRERIWIVAYSSSNAIAGQNRESSQAKRAGIAVNEQIRGGQLQAIQHKGLDDLSRYASNSGLFGSQEAGEQTTGIEQCGESITTDSESIKDNRRRQGGFYTEPAGVDDEGNASDTNQLNGNCSGLCSGERSQFKETEILGDTANSNETGLQRSEKFRGFGTIRTERNKQPAGLLCTNWSNFPTVSPLRSGNDGFSRDALRLFINENSGGLLTEKEVDTIIQKSLNKWNNETIAAGGDAVVSGVVLQIFKAIAKLHEYESQK